MDPIVAASRQMIRVGSRSFASAARLLGPGAREGAYQLYAWCRYCDDRIDLQDLGRGTPAGMAPAGDARLAARSRLEQLTRETVRALDGAPVSDPVFVALQRVVLQHAIPHRHPLELLQGFAMDVEARRYRTLEDVLTYCYHVAGVVGVMMAHVMGAQGKDTLDRAADLGLALQMTNIARDVMEDAQAGRVYLPESWLEEAGVPVPEIRERRHREAVHGVVRRLLAEADRYYRSAGDGVARLPLRSAWSIATARGVYRDIGALVRRRGSEAWDRRAVVSKPRKLWRVAQGGLEALLLIALRRRARPCSRQGLWNRPDAGPAS
jgi:phytoene synthase